MKLPKSGQNARKQSKNTKKLLKIAKIWPRYNVDHQNYSPIRAPGQNQLGIPESMAKKQMKWPKMPLNGYKSGKN